MVGDIGEKVGMRDIRFDPCPTAEDLPRFLELRRHIGIPDFAAYRELFERAWAERLLLSGKCVEVRQLPPDYTPAQDHPFHVLMAVNEHTGAKGRTAVEFLDQYERLGRKRFLSKAAESTGYARFMLSSIECSVGSRIPGLSRFRVQRALLARMLSFLVLYDNMKLAGQVVGAGRTPGGSAELQARDLPWAIDYLGYVKLCDGAHRRAIASYLGWKAIPTLVLDFQQVTEEELANAPSWLRQSFPIFHEIVVGAARAWDPGQARGDITPRQSAPLRQRHPLDLSSQTKSPSMGSKSNAAS